MSTPGVRDAQEVSQAAKEKHMEQDELSKAEGAHKESCNGGSGMKENRGGGRRTPYRTDGRALSQLGRGGAPRAERTLEEILEEAETAEGEDKIHHLAKIPDLFQCWISNYDRYIHLFFQEFSAVDSENKNLVHFWSKR